MTSYQISDIRDLNRIVDHFCPCASVALLEHRLVNNDCRFNVFRGISDVTLESASSVQVRLVVDESSQMLLASGVAPFKIS